MAALEIHPGKSRLRAAVTPLEDGSEHLSAYAWRPDPTAATLILRRSASCCKAASCIIHWIVRAASAQTTTLPMPSCHCVLRRGWRMRPARHAAEHSGWTAVGYFALKPPPCPPPVAARDALNHSHHLHGDTQQTQWPKSLQLSSVQGIRCLAAKGT